MYCENINRATSKWSQSCHPRGSALLLLLLKPLDWAWSRIVFQTIVCNANKKSDIITTKLKIKDIHYITILEIPSFYSCSYSLSPFHKYPFPSLPRTNTIWVSSLISASRIALLLDLKKRLVVSLAFYFKVNRI